MTLLGRFGVTTEVLSFDSSAPRRVIALSTRLSGTRITTWAVTFPKLNFLDDLKAVAERAEFDPDNFWLDKFTATFCTWHLRKASIFGLCNHGWDHRSSINHALSKIPPRTHARVNETLPEGV